MTIFANHNPFIRHIVRRTRDFRKTPLIPKQAKYLRKIEVELKGEDDEEY